VLKEPTQAKINFLISGLTSDEPAGISGLILIKNK